MTKRRNRIIGAFWIIGSLAVVVLGLAISMNVAALPANFGPPVPTAPECPTHNNRAYHSLWDPVRNCHYNHTHKDNPHDVDDIFGTSFYQWAGGEISYPWQTSSHHGNENDIKHGGYTWLVRRDLPCYSQFTNGCVTDFRVQVHAIGSTQDAYVRYHSYWLEARVCREDVPTDCGIVRTGGWSDTGDLLVDNNVILNEAQSGNSRKLHFSGDLLPDGEGNEHFGTWYSGSQEGWATVAVQFEDMWGLINRDGNPEPIHLFCEAPADCGHNGSKVQPHVIGATILNRYRRTVDPDRNGYADFNGYINRYGVPVMGCTTIGLNCIPLMLEHVPLGYLFQYRGTAREYDLYFDGEPSGWIEYPN